MLHKKERSWYWHDTLVATDGSISCAAGERLGEHLVNVLFANLAPIPGGDIVIPTGTRLVGIERKAPDDAIQSWYTGHLAEQLSTMLGYYSDVMLLLEQPERWDFDWFGDPAASYWHWWDDLLTFQENGVRLYFSLGIEHSAAIVAHLQQRYGRDDHGALTKLPRQPKLLYQRVLSAVPGWGPVTARQAVANIGPPYKVVTSTPAHLTRVGLISPRKVRLLFDAFGRRLHGKKPAGRMHTGVQERKH